MLQFEDRLIMGGMPDQEVESSPFNVYLQQSYFHRLPKPVRAPGPVGKSTTERTSGRLDLLLRKFADLTELNRLPLYSEPLLLFSFVSMENIPVGICSYLIRGKCSGVWAGVPLCRQFMPCMLCAHAFLRYWIITSTSNMPPCC